MNIGIKMVMFENEWWRYRGYGGCGWRGEGIMGLKVEYVGGGVKKGDGEVKLYLGRMNRKG